MKNIMLIFVLFFCALNLFAQTNTEKVNENVVKNIVLIDKTPWEVLMSKNGDILAKIKDVPDYLKGFENSPTSNTYLKPVKKAVVVDNTKTKAVVYKTHEENVVNSNENKTFDVGNRLEVGFGLGSALLKSEQISFLNEIADMMVDNKNLKFNIFGFNSEPEYRFYILSKRRMDAVLGYLKVKGVNIDDQIIVNSSVKGKNNKIVFAPVR